MRDYPRKRKRVARDASRPTASIVAWAIQMRPGGSLGWLLAPVAPPKSRGRRKPSPESVWR